MYKHFDKIKVEKTLTGEAVITGEITLESLEQARGEALKHLNGEIEISGFRKGNIPENILVKNLGEMKVLEETAEVALAHQYGNIMSETKLKPIGRPEVAITKLVPGIPLEFKITITLEPEFDLPDYKKIASEASRHSVSGDSTLSVSDKFRAKEKYRLEILESIIKATEIKIPKLLIDSELDRMVGQFQDDVERHMKPARPDGRSGGWDEYLKSIKKTEEDIRKEWREKAEERSKAELIMLKIAETEKLSPTPEELEAEANHLLSHHKDADPMRVRMYVYQQFQNQKVFEFFETQQLLDS
ncbi:MAG: trigger factor [Patescibacteria group bacterium]|mgnify:CR=1 FL=1